jgi:hypothetical protein
VAELILKITGDSRDAEAKLAGLERAVARTSGTISRATGTLNQFYGGVGRFATSASADLQRLERNATRAAAALRSAQIEARGGGRIGGAAGAGIGGGIGAGGRDFLLGAVGGGVAGATSAALGGASSFVQESVGAYVEGTRATAFLEATAKRAKVSYADLRGEVSLLRREFNLSQADAERALAQATRVAAMAGRPGGGGDLLRATTRAAAAAGVSPDRVPDLIRQLGTGSDEATDLLLGVNPSTLYQQEARRTGRKESSFSDQERTLIRINAVLREGNASMAAYNAYLDSAAGKTDRLSALWADVKAKSGEALANILPYALAAPTAGLTLAYGAGGGGAAPQSGGLFDIGRGVLGAGAAGSNLIAQGFAAFQANQQAQRARVAGFGDAATEARWQGILRERDLANAETRSLPDRIAALRGQQGQLQSSLAQGALGIFALQNRRAALGETPETAEQLRRRIFGTADTLGGRAGAQYTIEALGSYDPRRLSTEARDRLKAALDTEIKARTDEEREKMRLLAKISAHLEQLVGQQAPKTAIPGEKPERPVDVRITDASPTTTASITGVQRGVVGSVSGDGGVTDFPL